MANSIVPAFHVVQKSTTKDQQALVKHAKDSHRPVLVSSRGRGIAVVQGLDEYEKNIEELAFTKAIAKGMLDIKEGNKSEIADVKTRLGL